MLGMGPIYGHKIDGKPVDLGVLRVQTNQSLLPGGFNPSKNMRQLGLSIGWLGNFK